MDAKLYVKLRDDLIAQVEREDARRETMDGLINRFIKSVNDATDRGHLVCEVERPMRYEKNNLAAFFNARLLFQDRDGSVILAASIPYRFEMGPHGLLAECVGFGEVQLSSEQAATPEGMARVVTLMDQPVIDAVNKRVSGIR